MRGALYHKRTTIGTSRLHHDVPDSECTWRAKFNLPIQFAGDCGKVELVGWGVEFEEEDSIPVNGQGDLVLYSRIRSVAKSESERVLNQRDERCI